MEKLFDVVVIGGGPAGLSCALTLARGGRQVAVCDDGHPRNASAKVMHNFPALDGINPSDFLKNVRENLLKYEEVTFISNKAKDVVKKENIFVTILEDNSKIESKKIVLAEGLKDELPDITGIEEGWGKCVFQCPYCHAYEFKAQSIGILAHEKSLFHTLKLLLGFSNDIAIFTDGKNFITEEDLAIFQTKGIELYEEKVESLVLENEHLKGIRLESGEIIPRDVLFIRPASHLKSDIGKRLGCHLTENGTFNTDENCKSCVSGVYIAGDVSSKMHSVLLACAEGSKAGLNLNLELMEEEFNSHVSPILIARQSPSLHP